MSIVKDRIVIEMLGVNKILTEELDVIIIFIIFQYETLPCEVSN